MTLDSNIRKRRPVAVMCGAGAALLIAACGGATKTVTRIASPTPQTQTAPAPAAAATTSAAPTSTSTAATGATAPVGGIRTAATPASFGCPVTSPACITTSPQATVLGSTNISTNLSQLIAHDHPELLHPEAKCTGTTYPIGCALLAYDTTRKSVVNGTAKIIGIYTLPHTYVYELDYGPATGNAGTVKPPAGTVTSTGKGATGL